jgi:hypothetical protein
MKDKACGESIGNKMEIYNKLMLHDFIKILNV